MELSLPTCTSCLLILIAFFIWVTYLHMTRNYDYWKKLSIPYEKPTFPFGNIWDTVMQRKSLLEFYRNVYNSFKGQRYAGILMMTEPALLVFDPDLIKHLFVKDFSHFHDRGVLIDEENNPMSGNLFHLQGSRWHALRNKMSPTFTSGKMKYMFAVVKACAEHLQKTTAEEMMLDQNIELKDLMSRYTTDVISSAAFGVEAGSLENPDSEFRMIGRRVFSTSIANSLRNAMVIFAPNLCLKLGIEVVDPIASRYFTKILKETVAYREANKVQREDFLQILIGLMNEDKEASSQSGLTMNQLLAQCFVFLVGGYETSASTLSFCLYELSQNVDLQQQVREEVECALAEHDGVMTYDALVKMQLMERVVYETLRKYPSSPVLFRECTKEYVIPDCNESTKWKPETKRGGHVIKQGVKVQIPVSGLHYDPDYFSNPEKFDPDRFTEEGKKKWPSFAYLPFGEGPRICLGMRFGIMQIKAGLTTLLTKFELRPSPKTPSPIAFEKSGFIPAVKDGLWIRFLERPSA